MGAVSVLNGIDQFRFLGMVAESEWLIPRGREERGRAGSWVSGGGNQGEIERAGYGRAGMHGGSLYDAKGLRPLGLPPGHANWFPLETTCATAQAFWLRLDL